MSVHYALRCSLLPKIINGGVAGVVGITCVFPIDLCKTRIQNQQEAGGARLYRNIWDCFVKTYRAEGFRAMYKGLAVTVPLHLSQMRAGTTPEAIQQALAAHYEGERFIRVMPLRDADTLAEGAFDVQACNDTNRVDLFVFGSDTQVLVMARLDNLGKGASGAAVQAMNVHLGLDEGLGLV